MTSLEEAIEKGIDKSSMVFTEVGLAWVAEAVRAWAREEAELYFGGYASYPTMHRHLAVPLDKFGGDERHVDGSRKSGRGYDPRK